MVLIVSVLPFSGRGVDLPRAVILISCTTAELKRREHVGHQHPTAVSSVIVIPITQLTHHDSTVHRAESEGCRWPPSACSCAIITVGGHRQASPFMHCTGLLAVALDVAAELEGFGGAEDGDAGGADGGAGSCVC